MTFGAGHSSWASCMFVCFIPCRFLGFTKCYGLKMKWVTGYPCSFIMLQSLCWFNWTICWVDLLAQGITVDEEGESCLIFGIVSVLQKCQSVSLHSGSRMSPHWVLFLIPFCAEETTCDCSLNIRLCCSGDWPIHSDLVLLDYIKYNNVVCCEWCFSVDVVGFGSLQLQKNAALL